jgi:hypothetical protein
MQCCALEMGGLGKISSPLRCEPKYAVQCTGEIFFIAFAHLWLTFFVFIITIIVIIHLVAPVRSSHFSGCFSAPLGAWQLATSSVATGEQCEQPKQRHHLKVELQAESYLSSNPSFKNDSATNDSAKKFLVQFCCY